MFIRRIGSLNVGKASQNSNINNKQNTNYLSNPILNNPLKADTCSFKGNPSELNQAIGTVIDSILVNPQKFHEIKVPFKNPDPARIKLENLTLRAKNILEKNRGFIEVNYKNPDANGSINILSFSTKRIEATDNEAFAKKALAENIINKLVAETDYIY